MSFPRSGWEQASGSFGLRVAISRPCSSRHWLAGVGTRTTGAVTAFPLALVAALPLAAPHEWRGRLIPMLGNRLEPGHDLLGRVGVLTRQRPPLQDTLDALCPVQPTARQRCVQGHNSLR